MPQFKFYFDKKVSTWYRSLFSVQGENYEEAENKAKDMFESGRLEEQNEEDGFIKEYTEKDFDEYITVEENGGFHTEELLNSDLKTIKMNKDYE